MILAKPWLATTAKVQQNKIVCKDYEGEFLPIPQTINKDLFITGLSDDRFFYKIKTFKDEKIKYLETGVARLKGDVLERLEFFECYEYNRKANRPSNREFVDGTVMCISSYYPDTIPLSNVILTSDGVIELGDSDILTTDSYSEIVKYIENLKKPLNIKNLKVGNLTLSMAGRPVKPKPGTIIFNKRSGKLEFWDGVEWLSIRFEE